jgi:hypothetical protein
MLQYDIYFVWQTPCGLKPYRVVVREVRTRTQKGYPISYSLKSLPEAFETREKAQFFADQLNREYRLGIPQPQEFVEVQDIV